MSAARSVVVYLRTPRTNVEPSGPTAPEPRDIAEPEPTIHPAHVDLAEMGGRIIDDFLSMPDITFMSPMHLEGGTTIRRVLLNCAACDLPCVVICGERTQPFPWMAEFVGLGFCMECRFFTPFNTRFRQKAGEPQVIALWREYGKWRSEAAIEESGAFWRRCVIGIRRMWNWTHTRHRRQPEVDESEAEERT